MLEAFMMAKTSRFRLTEQEAEDIQHSFDYFNRNKPAQPDNNNQED